jgi:transposase
VTKAGNKYLRPALYMPALVAIQHEPNVRAFYEKLLARGKKPLQAIVAVMRKVLHALRGRASTAVDARKRYQTPIGARCWTSAAAPCWAAAAAFTRSG